MAARTRHLRHDEHTKRRIQASQLLNRLVLFANGKVFMSHSQVLAAKIVIGKSIPDLKSIEHTGKDGGPIYHEGALNATLCAEESYLRMLHGERT
jgi:hypothetical protein